MRILPLLANFFVESKQLGIVSIRRITDVAGMFYYIFDDFASAITIVIVVKVQVEVILVALFQLNNPLYAQFTSFLRHNITIMLRMLVGRFFANTGFHIVTMLFVIVLLLVILIRITTLFLLV